MVKLNTAATGHGSKTETYASGAVRYFNVFPEASDTDKKRLEKAEEAYRIIDNLAGRLTLHEPCNKYFLSLPRARSFSDIWKDDTIFINYSPDNRVGYLASTHTGFKDITLSMWCLDNQNRWMVAASIVHELAHIAGAPRGASHDAEKAVDKCYFKDQYDPNIMGSIQNTASMLEKMA